MENSLSFKGYVVAGGRALGDAISETRTKRVMEGSLNLIVMS